jgi:hypothetical protein
MASVVKGGSPFLGMQSLRGGVAWERAGDRGSAATRAHVKWS